MAEAEQLKARRAVKDIKKQLYHERGLKLDAFHHFEDMVAKVCVYVYKLLPPPPLRPPSTTTTTTHTHIHTHTHTHIHIHWTGTHTHTGQGHTHWTDTHTLDRHTHTGQTDTHTHTHTHTRTHTASVLTPLFVQAHGEDMMQLVQSPPQTADTRKGMYV